MKEKILTKIVLVLIIIGLLLAMPLDIFATSSGAIDINNSWEDQTTDTDGNGTTTTPEQTTPTTTPTNTPTTTPTTDVSKNEEFPKAGLAENTMMIVTVVALGTVALFANKKINELKNI